ncbi:glycosyltransferase family 4 protein [Sphingomonas sp. 1P08PE]|uniref:glycosyltransferase family 4 protein n=1 Tax=Sphingomonas sp. 1P08PE TaxID=554122 RepID=UPI0039A3480E
MNLAYLRHFASRARAVVQHRGVTRVLGELASQSLFALLADATARARSGIAAHLAKALAIPLRPTIGSLYLNVSHTDFDLPSHSAWLHRHALRAIYLIHDLIPILHPDHCRPRAVVRHTGRVDAALRHGSGIIVGSAAVARDLEDYAGRRRSSTPPVAISALAGATLDSTATRCSDLGDFFLCVGTIESRKNHLLLLRAWERLRERLGPSTPRLVIVGRWGTGSEEFREALDRSGMSGNLIEVLDHCGDDELATMMATARAMLMPSLAEGFGLPMAEALRMGVPVIASDLPCFREVGQGIPCLLDPHDVAAWVARIVALDQATARRQRKVDALHGYRASTWDQHFARVDPWLAEIASSPARSADLGTTSASAPARAPDGRTLDLEI